MGKAHFKGFPVMSHAFAQITLAFFLYSTLVVLECGTRFFDYTSVELLSISSQLELLFFVWQIVIGLRVQNFMKSLIAMG